MATLEITTSGYTVLIGYNDYSLHNWYKAGAHTLGMLGKGSVLYYKYGGGILFENVPIPQGATITVAYLKVPSGTASSLTTVNSYITGNKEANPAIWGNFSTLADYQARRGTVVGGADNSKLTTAQVAWDNITAFTYPPVTWYNSPSIVSIVQEIINQPAFVSGNNLAVFWDDHDGRSTSYRYYVHKNGYNDLPADPIQVILHVEYISAISVQTNAATSITSSGATLNGTLVADGGLGGLYCNFEYGLTTDYGSTTGAEVIQQGSNFAHPVTGLLPGTVYHFRAKTVNIGTGYYGSDLTFTTLGSSFPASSMVRVTALIHRYDRFKGVYQIEANLGGISTDFGLPEWLGRAKLIGPKGESLTEEDVRKIVAKTTDNGLGLLGSITSRPSIPSVSDRVTASSPGQIPLLGLQPSSPTPSSIIGLGFGVNP